jgi:hypothetical protein
MMRGSGYARSKARMGRIRDAVWGRAAWYRNGQLPDNYLTGYLLQFSSDRLTN